MPDYFKQWRVDRARGILRLVDASEAKSRVDTLIGAGWSARAIAAAAGISVQSVTRLLSGQPRANRTTVAAILTVDPSTVPSVASKQTTEPFVPRIGTVRRIQALLAMGWPHAVLQDRSGVRTSVLLAQQGRWVTRSTHDKITALYDDLSMTHGPSTRTRGRARVLGYALPLEWDDIDSDPTPVAAATLERDDLALIEDLQFIAEHGDGATEAARRTGFASTKSLDKWLRRHDQVPLLNQLTRQDYAALTNNGPTRHLRSAG